MQPRWGRKLGARAEAPTYEATKTASREVVIPGFTGAPSAPRKPRSIARSLSSASSPPTMKPFGQESWYSTRGRGTPRPVGTTTHGPATGTQTIRPLHSFVAPAGATPSASAEAASAASTATRLTGRPS